MAANVSPITIASGTQAPESQKKSGARAQSELRQMLQDGGVSQSGVNSFMKKVNDESLTECGEGLSWAKRPQVQ